MTDTVAPPPMRGPSRSAELVGRDADVVAVQALLADPGVRLVAVTGPVGVGKSRLVAEVALLARHREGLVVHVPLASVTDIRLAADTVVAAVRGSAEYVATPAQALWRLADGADVLLVLDDGDEVERLPQLVVELLGSYPGLTVLAAQVRPLKVAGERVVPVRPLPVPGPANDGPAMELFAARATTAYAAFVLDDETRAAVAAVCRTVNGLPLAIEVAAARVGAVPPTVMARQLERSLGALHQDGTFGVPERHRSVDAALEWSIGMLSQPAVSLLTQLAVFESSFPLVAAQRVVAPRRSQPELLDLMSELVDSHLVNLDVDDDEVHLHLDPLVRHHARRRLAESGDEGRVRDAHADFWAARCRLDPSTASRCWPDVLAALDRRLATGQQHAALQLAVAATSDLSGSPGAQATLLPLVESVLRDGSVSDEALVARTLMWATVHSPTDGDGMTAYGVWTARRLRQSIDLARSSGDDRALLEALELVVSTLGVTFDLEGAVVSALEGHDLAVRIGDEKAVSRFEIWVAMARHLEGDLGAMAQCARSAYERGLRAGDDTAVVHAVLMLRGLPPDEQGPVPLLELDELLRRADALRQPTLVLHVLAVTTTAALAVGDQPSALESLGRMLLIAEGLDRTWPMASVGPIMLALPVALARGALEDAVRIRESLADIEHLLPSITPSMAPAYLAAVAPLRECVPPDRYDALAAEVRGVTLSQANRRVQAIVREYLPRTTSTARRPRVASSVTGTTLTPRELDVLEQLVAGGTNSEIADVLGLTAKTVMHHTVAIYRKLGVRGRAEAVAWALRSGTVPFSSPRPSR